MTTLVRFNTSVDVLPDVIPFEFYDTQGRLVYQGNSTDIEGVRTARGFSVKVTYEWRDDLAPGEYTVEFTIAGTDTKHSIQQTVEGPPTRIEDIVVLDGLLRVKDIPIAEGVWRLFRNNNVVQSGVFTDGVIPEVAIEGTPSLTSMMLVIEDDAGEMLDVEVYYINVTILKAIRELKHRLDRLNRALSLSLMEFTDSDYLHWLAAGRDRFNSVPMATDFTMTAASGPILDFWLASSQLAALRVRYLEEGLAAYTYSGAAVDLSVDTTQYIESAAQAIETRLENEAVRLKTNMHQRGLTSGSGQWNLSNRAIGAVGMTLGPAAGRGSLGLGYPR